MGSEIASHLLPLDLLLGIERSVLSHSATSKLQEGVCFNLTFRFSERAKDNGVAPEHRDGDAGQLGVIQMCSRAVTGLNCLGRIQEGIPFDATSGWTPEIHVGRGKKLPNKSTRTARA